MLCGVVSNFYKKINILGVAGHAYFPEHEREGGFGYF